MWVGDMSFWYYLLTYLIFDIVYTMIPVPYETLVPEMTDDFKQKTKFSGRVSLWRRCPLFWLPSSRDPAHAFRQRQRDLLLLCKLVFSVLCALMLTFVWFFTRSARGKSGQAALRAEEEKKADPGQSLNRLLLN
ncbi:MFS transporter [Enterobacter hormaechei]|uniref:MFS transporter n=1 Tax=Enterobacter hormaechei TaxID=158836 RepID=A0A4Y5ZNN0_9ENTR|nr:MFS transporter [Enterobacter hormaechei]